MVCSEIVKHNFSIVRITFGFYPIKGGSITHILELSKKIDPWIKSQIIVAPYFGDTSAFDKKFGVPIIRIKYPKRIEYLKFAKIPIVPFVLTGYAMNVAKFLKEKYGIEVLKVEGKGEVGESDVLCLNRKAEVKFVLEE